MMNPLVNRAVITSPIADDVLAGLSKVSKSLPPWLFYDEVGSRLFEQITELPEGECEWQAAVAEPREMLPWICGWGADCEVLAPADLRNTLIREARRLARLYKLPPATRAANPPAEPKEPDDEARLKRTFSDFFGG